MDCRARTRRWTGRGGGDANGWVAVLRKAHAAGLGANLELMTTGAERLAELGRPCLPHLDWLIVNDYEIGALAGRETRRADGSTDPAAVARAIEDVLALGSMRWAAAHFPQGAVVGGRDGSRLALGSVALPASAIVGANGAGDAFAAGMLYGLHEQWPIVECIATRTCVRRGVDARGVDDGRGRNGRRVPQAGEAVGLPAAGAERLTWLQAQLEYLRGIVFACRSFRIASSSCVTARRLTTPRTGCRDAEFPSSSACAQQQRREQRRDSATSLNAEGREQARAVGRAEPSAFGFTRILRS